jgi:hypothetical protein
MTKGVLIFAQNNSEIDYVKLAVCAAKRVKEHLNVPVSLITDSPDHLLTLDDAQGVFDQVIDLWKVTDYRNSQIQNRSFHDGTLKKKILKWNNFSRADCYDLSPYDETLVIDSDYIICSDNLVSIWGNVYDFAIYKTSFDLSRWRVSYDHLNQYSIPFYWATVFYFKKNQYTEAFFDLVQKIKENWSYYRLLYCIDAGTFRNDYAFSIAINIMNGGDSDGNFASPLPGKLYYTVDKDIVESIQGNQTRVLVEKESFPGEYVALKTTGIDVHLMNKYSLVRAINIYKKEVI